MKIYLQKQNFKENTVEKLSKVEVYTQQITKCKIHNPPRSSHSMLENLIIFHCLNHLNKTKLLV